RAEQRGPGVTAASALATELRRTGVETEVRRDAERLRGGEAEVHARAVAAQVIVRIGALRVEQVAAEVVVQVPRAAAAGELGFLWPSVAVVVARLAGLVGGRVAARAHLERIHVERNRRRRAGDDAPVLSEPALPVLDVVLSLAEHHVPPRVPAGAL